MKGSVALLAGALPAIVLCSHALPPVRQTSHHARSTLPATTTTSASEAAFVVTTIPFPTSSLGEPGRSSRRSNAPRPTRPRTLEFVPALQCSARHKRPRAGAVSFGSSSVAGVEGAFEAAAAAGLDRDLTARRVGVDGSSGAPAEVAVDSDDDEALDAFGSAVAASCAVVDEGELICQKLEGVISREAEVAEQEVLLRVAHLDDYFAIADVRFDVFSPVHSTLKHRFRERSCLLMRERRRRGAFCLVAALGESARAAAATAAAADRGAAGGSEAGVESGGEGGGGVDVDVDAVEVSHNHVLGTLECSRHEFDGTPLEVQVEEGGAKIARLYLTEVAVRSDCRRMGVGRVLLGLVDDVAKELKTSEVFLHVNEINEAALRLYESCGYNDAPDNASNRAFTNSLGLSGGFIGQRHRLLHKTFPTA